MKSFTRFLTEYSLTPPPRSPEGSPLRPGGPFDFLMQTLANSPLHSVWRLDASHIPKFTPQPYSMDKTGSSVRGTTPHQDWKPFSGVYAARELAQIAPYALTGKTGKTSSVSWVASYQPDQRPVLYIHEHEFNQDHAPVHLTQFSKYDFVPRHQITSKLWGNQSTDTVGTDEWIAESTPNPIGRKHITDPQEFVRQFMDVRVIPSVNGKPDTQKMETVKKSLQQQEQGDVIINGNTS